MIDFMISQEIGPVLFAGGLAAPLIGSLGLAIRRSTRRQECARLRDQLVDAARSGELDVTDWRLFSLIDWFDQVATTGRTDIPGRHAFGRHTIGRRTADRHIADPRDPAGSLVRSLAGTLLPLGPGPVQWPWSGPPPIEADIRSIALSYRERHQYRPRHRLSHQSRHLPRRPSSTRIQVATRTPSARTPSVLVMPSSLTEEIFAVAGSGR